VITAKPLTPLNRTLVVTTVLAALIVAVVFWLDARNKSDDQWVVHSLAIREQLMQVLSLVQSAETGQRGYLLTGRNEYRAPYDQAVEQVAASLDRLSHLVDNEQRQQQVMELRRLVSAKLSELRSTVEEREAGHTEAALATVDSDAGLRLMQDVRDRISAIQTAEDGLLARRQSIAARSGILLQAGVGFAFLLICILGVLIARYTRRSVGEITAARDQLMTSNQALRDQITRREQVESQLRQSQKMQALGQLTGGIAHDFNNMLGVIMGAHDLISRRIKKGDYGIERFLDAATNATERAAILTQRLLAFARQQPLAPQPIDANKMIVNMSDLLHSTLGEKIRIETVAAAGLWTIHADAQQLENAILNIAINARDAMPDGGKVTIETANAFLDEAYCRQNPEVAPGQFVMIAITDTGNGMSPEVASRVFDPFFTTKPAGKGTGLGLSQVYGFVKQSHGHIKIYSEVGAGTNVKIYLSRLVTAASASFLPLMSGITTSVNSNLTSATRSSRRPGLKVLFTTGYTANAVVHGGVLDAGVYMISGQGARRSGRIAPVPIRRLHAGFLGTFFLFLRAFDRPIAIACLRLCTLPPLPPLPLLAVPRL
jgi:signal transduction histidine kinase